MKFKPGDKVKCVKAEDSFDLLIENKIYTVSDVYKGLVSSEPLVHLCEFPTEGGFYADRFVLVSPYTTLTTSNSNQPGTSIQIGGSHYKDLPIQPVEFITKNNLTYLQGNVIKYITRYKNKNGLEDLKKAKHYIDLIIEMEYSEKEKKDE